MNVREDCNENVIPSNQFIRSVFILQVSRAPSLLFTKSFLTHSVSDGEVFVAFRIVEARRAAGVDFLWNPPKRRRNEKPIVIRNSIKIINLIFPKKIGRVHIPINLRMNLNSILFLKLQWKNRHKSHTLQY